MRSNVKTLFLSLALAGLAGCGSSASNHGLKDKDQVNYPEWVGRGSGAFGGEKKVFYGVGSVNGVKNPSLARDTAGNRAIDEISKIFEVYSASLMKDYSASTTAGDMSATSEEQHVTNAVKTFTANTLHGIQIVDRWVHPDGTYYALARLDLGGFMDQLDQAKELNEKVKEQVKRSAEKSFSDLESEEAKRKAQ
jgi:hypothetical protein